MAREGRAFERLQEEIIKTSTDQSVFAFVAPMIPTSGYNWYSRGVFAASPAEFATTGNIVPHQDADTKAYHMSNKGLRITLPLLSVEEAGATLGGPVAAGSYTRIAVLRCRIEDDYIHDVGLWVQNSGQGEDHYEILDYVAPHGERLPFVKIPRRHREDRNRLQFIYLKQKTAPAYDYDRYPFVLLVETLPFNVHAGFRLKSVYPPECGDTRRSIVQGSKREFRTDWYATWWAVLLFEDVEASQTSGSCKSFVVVFGFEHREYFGGDPDPFCVLHHPIDQNVNLASIWETYKIPLAPTSRFPELRADIDHRRLLVDIARSEVTEQNVYVVNIWLEDGHGNEIFTTVSDLPPEQSAFPPETDGAEDTDYDEHGVSDENSIVASSGLGISSGNTGIDSEVSFTGPVNLSGNITFNGDCTFIGNCTFNGVYTLMAIVPLQGRPQAGRRRSLSF